MLLNYIRSIFQDKITQECVEKRRGNFPQVLDVDLPCDEHRAAESEKLPTLSFSQRSYETDICAICIQLKSM